MARHAAEQVGTLRVRNEALEAYLAAYEVALHAGDRRTRGLVVLLNADRAFVGGLHGCSDCVGIFV